MTGRNEQKHEMYFRWFETELRSGAEARAR